MFCLVKLPNLAINNRNLLDIDVNAPTLVDVVVEVRNTQYSLPPLLRTRDMEEKQVLEELSDLEQAIEDTAYKAVFKGINNALKDLGIAASSEAIPTVKEEPKSGATMKVRAQGRKGRGPAPKLGTLTKTQKEVMEAIQSHYDAEGVSPTYTELASQLDKSGVATIVHAIETKGWIRLNDQKYSRKIELLHRI